MDTDHQYLCVCECKEAIVWRAQSPLSGCHQNGSTSSFSSLELMPQWLHKPPAAAFFLFHMVVWCRHPIAPLVKPPNKWKSTSVLKLLMVIILPPSSPQSSPLPFLLTPSPQSPQPSSTNHLSQTAVFSVQRVLRIYTVLTSILFPVSSHRPAKRPGILYTVTSNAICLKVSRMTIKRWKKKTFDERNRHKWSQTEERWL